MSVRDLWDAGAPWAPSTAEAWGQGLSDRIDISTALVVQASAGAVLPTRPAVPNGWVTWKLFDKPGTANGPSDVQPLDSVKNISGTAWT